MPGFPPHTPSVKPHGVTIPSLTGSDAVFGQEVSEMEMILDRSDSPFCFTSTPPEPDGEETHQEVMNWRQDGDLQESGPLEQRWVLWHEFMKKHAHLDTWLRLAEQAVSSPNPAHITYITAKEELRKFERLQREAGSLLIQLDDLTHRNRTLTRLFHGAMQARLLASARSCGQRWDEVNAKLESIIGCRKLFVSEWEGFEAEREELALWLADLDVRLTEVDHLTGNTCEKLRRLQSFQQCVCTNSARVNALLQRGEALIQRSEPSDAQHVENRLLELLRGCGLAYNNIARTHTRLLSMRLVFEDDWILSQATDSGCPSENLLGEEGAPLDKTNLDLPASSNPWKAHPEPDFSPLCVPPPSPSSLSSPAHEHLGLEWDPSVDIGRSVSPDEADSSYFSINTGLCHRDGLKRRSYISSLGSQSDIINDIINQEADSQLEEHCDHSVSSPTAFQGGWTHLNKDQWVMSTPVRNDREVLSFDDGRVREWLGVQSPVLPVRRTSCSKAVQTDVEAECYLDGSYMEATSDQHHHNHTQQPLPAHSPISSHDLSATTDRLKQRSNLKVEEEQSCCEGAERHFSEQSVTSSSTNPSSSLLSPTLLSLLLAAALVLLACLIWVVTEPPCHRSSRMPRSFHLALRYVNGPPPT